MRIPAFAFGILLLCTAASTGAYAESPAPTNDNTCVPAPIAGPLFLRGSMTSWVLRNDLQFVYVCNAYLLNVDLHGAYEFRITDARFSNGSNFGNLRDAPAPVLGQPIRLVSTSIGNSENVKFTFDGRYTLRLRAIDAREPRLTIEPVSFDDPATQPVTDAIARSLVFDSRDQHDKTPFGAVAAGTEVTFRLRAAGGVESATLVVERRRLEGPQEILDYSEVARVALVRNAGDRDWHASYRFGDIGVYGYYFLVEIGGKKYVYENNADTIYWTRELGSNGAGTVAAFGDTQRIRRFRETIYRADFQVPAWARDIVYYYIFPERFRDGDPDNDPRPGPGTFHDQSVEFHSNWLDKPYRPGSGDGSDNIYGNDFFGGDLAGIIEKLDYIHDLGANTLYLTPIFRAASNHKYDTADYRTIDPHFGSNDDFSRLTREAAKRGMRVILDTSLNHTGTDSIYFDRYAKYPELGAFDGGHIQPDSPYASWYRFDPSQSDPEKQYHGWAGARDLPELDKSSRSFRDFAYGADDSVMKHWLDRGASGWRMDVAPWVPDDFWREWRSAVKGHRPDALTVCETQFESSKFFLGDEFDSTMNYIFRNAVEAYANGGDARASYRDIELMRETYPPQVFYALMNLLSTHDSPRALYDLGFRKDDDDAATIALAKRRLHLAVFFQMVFPGAPTVFYGDEVGVTGGEDPYDRVTYPWADRGGKPDNALHADFKRLIKMRHDNAVLRHGSIEAPLVIDEHVIVLLRHDGEQWAITATNNDDKAHSIDVQLPAQLRGATFGDALSGAKLRAGGDHVHVDIAALDGKVLTKH